MQIPSEELLLWIPHMFQSKKASRCSGICRPVSLAGGMWGQLWCESPWMGGLTERFMLQSATSVIFTSTVILRSVSQRQGGLLLVHASSWNLPINKKSSENTTVIHLNGGDLRPQLCWSSYKVLRVISWPWATWWDSLYWSHKSQKDSAGYWSASNQDPSGTIVRWQQFKFNSECLHPKHRIAQRRAHQVLPIRCSEVCLMMSY